MNERHKFLIKNTALLTISNFSSKILVFLLVPLYTNVLSTEEYGLYDVVNSTLQLMMPLLTANIIDGVMRFLLNKEKRENDIIRVGAKYVLLSIGCCAAVLFINDYFHLWDAVCDYSLMTFWLYTAFVLNQFAIQAAKGLEQVKSMAVAGVLGTLSTILFNLLFLLAIPYGLNGFFIANILGQMIPAIYIFFAVKIHHYLRSDSKKEDQKKTQKEMLRYSVPLISNTLGWWINGVSDRYVITYICGMAVNGIYSVAYKIPSIISTVQNIFIQAWQISAIKEHGEANAKKFYHNTFVALNAVMCLSCTMLILLTKPIAYILFAKEFYNAWEFVPFLLVSSVFNAASGYVGPILEAENKALCMAKSAIYGSVVNVVLNFVLVYWMGAQGAAIATAVASFTIYYFREKNSSNLVRGPQYRSIVLSWLVLCVQAVVMICVDHVLIQLIAPVIVVSLYFGTLKNILQKMAGFYKNKRKA